MSVIPVTHRLVRALCIGLGLGAAVGIVVCLMLAAQPSILARLFAGMAAVLYAGIGWAAYGLWRGHRLGLHWTRLLLLLQVPVVQTPWLVYNLFAAAALDVYVGTTSGVWANVGASFHWFFGPSGRSGYLVGVNVVALVAFVLLGRVRLEPKPNYVFATPLEVLAAQD
ncbi:hypothetical protein [Dyella jiangningensis]